MNESKLFVNFNLVFFNTDGQEVQISKIIKTGDYAIIINGITQPATIKKELLKPFLDDRISNGVKINEDHYKSILKNALS